MAITKPLSYKGCDPEVEKALRASMSILCYVSDYNERPTKEDSGEVEIVAYVPGESLYPYVDFNRSAWNYATPAKKPVKWIMPPEKAIPILVREGWKFNERGSLVKKVGTSSFYYISPNNFQYFGVKLSDVGFTFNLDALSCIIEEK